MKLKTHLISQQAKNDLYNFLYRNANDNNNININNELSNKNIRIASFYYSPIYKEIYFIKTIPWGPCDILNINDPNIIYSLANDIYVKIVNNNMYDSHLIVSYDIYYNRKRDRAGLFHRDMNNLIPPEKMINLPYDIDAINMFNQPNYVSLEFFSEPGKLYLGPEVIYYPEDTSSEFNQQIVYKNIADTRKTSFRVLVQDGTVIMFNNFAYIHATPTTIPIIVNEEIQMDTTALFIDNPYRLGQTNDISEPILNTENDIRTFVRSYIKILDATKSLPIDSSQIIRNVLYNNQNVNTVFKVNQVSPNDYFQFNPLEISKHIRGGTISLDNFYTINNFPTIINPTTQIKKATQTKQISKIEPIKLMNFKIKNDHIKINLDIDYPEIKKKYIGIMQKKENEFLKMIKSKKIGNRKTRFKTRSKSKMKTRSKSKMKSSKIKSKSTKMKTRTKSKMKTRTKSKMRSSKSKSKMKTRSKSKMKSSNK
jgi:RNA polymerase-associated protein CTR9/transcription factor SPN1